MWRLGIWLGGRVGGRLLGGFEGIGIWGRVYRGEGFFWLGLAWLGLFSVSRGVVHCIIYLLHVCIYSRGLESVIPTSVWIFAFVD